MPATARGEPFSRLAWPLRTRNTPPLVEPSSLPYALTNTLRLKNAKSVGVGRPWASVLTAAPLAAVGGGGACALAAHGTRRQAASATSVARGNGTCCTCTPCWSGGERTRTLSG